MTLDVQQVFAALPIAWGLEAGSLLQPQRYPIHDSSELEVQGGNAVRALAGHKSCSQWCLPLQDPWQVHCSGSDACASSQCASNLAVIAVNGP
jgi:hypothetical protein